MPHKANPTTSGNICGLAKLVRAYVNPVLEGTALWHERDLTHSSVERVAVPDAAALTEHILNNTVALIENLIVDVDRMADTARRAETAAISASALVALCDLGVPWNEAREIVRAASRADGPVGLVDRIGERLRYRPELAQMWVQNEPIPAQPRTSTVFETVNRLLDGTDGNGRRASG